MSDKTLKSTLKLQLKFELIVVSVDCEIPTDGFEPHNHLLNNDLRILNLANFDMKIHEHRSF